MTLTSAMTRPTLDHDCRAKRAHQIREQIAQLGLARPTKLVESNMEELLYRKSQPTSFTKGLPHDAVGLVDRDDYTMFVTALTHPDQRFMVPQTPDSRKWESPLAGHYFDIEGPDPASVAMAPAPKLGSAELTAEIATLYAMALLRDVSFQDMENGSTKIGFGYPQGHPRATSARSRKATLQDLVDELRKLAWHDPQVDIPGLTAHEQRRRAALWESPEDGLTLSTLFRGSTRGAKAGPMISQFLLLGTLPRQAAMGDDPNIDTARAGKIAYGVDSIDQRIETAEGQRDYMTDWASWLEVQNGADTKGRDVFKDDRQFITTPRDLATYVHFDELYQAYLNAAFICNAYRVPVDPGTPIVNTRSDTSEGFATWGGPHLLSLVTEVASRALRAVRRQKFQIHRRGRPEVLAARLTQVHHGRTEGMDQAAIDAIETMLSALGADDPADTTRPGVILHWISELNARNNGTTASVIAASTPDGADTDISAATFLLPMAFPEGSPMHPAYGAGHATVAGACVTILKAFFDKDTPMAALHWSKAPAGETPKFVRPDSTGTKLEDDRDLGDTLLSDELDKLAANIAIGRNHAGVHFYTDYYDSLRMGERVAVGILQEQMLTYNERVTLRFRDFDGHDITLATDGTGMASKVTLTPPAGMTEAEWWTFPLDGYPAAQDPNPNCTPERITS